MPCSANGFVSVAGKCIRIHYEAVDWYTANAMCKEEGASLLKIDDNVVNKEMKTFLQRFDGTLRSHRHLQLHHNQERDVAPW